MNFSSIFDIIGPTMVGPSSSHTAGAVRIGLVSRKILGGDPTDIKVYLYGSFAETYKGHGTDLALVGGLLGYDTDNKKIPESMETAKNMNIKMKFIPTDDLPPHPNTAKVIISNNTENACVTGISIGGGSMQTININGVNTKLEDDNIQIFVIKHDPHRLKEVKNLLKDQKITKVNYDNSKVMLNVVRCDKDIKMELMNKLKSIDYILDVFDINS